MSKATGATQQGLLANYFGPHLAPHLAPHFAPHVAPHFAPHLAPHAAPHLAAHAPFLPCFFFECFLAPHG